MPVHTVLTDQRVPVRIWTDDIDARSKAQLAMERWMIQLPDCDLAYFPEGTEHFDDYVAAVHWAQDYAMSNRQAMLQLVLAALARHLPPFTVTTEAVNCHHNYVTREHHFGADVWVTRNESGSPKPTWPRRPPASSAARTRACSTRFPARTRTSIR